MMTNTLKQAFRAVIPHWLLLCLLSMIWGLTLQTFPGLMEGAEYYATAWPDNLAHHDPYGYILVAEQGYGADGRETQSSVRYPLFPLFNRLVAQITGMSGALTAFWVSKLALLAGLIGLWLLTHELHDAHLAGRAVAYMLFPLLGTGFTWFMSYPEPIHLLSWSFGFYFLLKRQHYVCGLITILGIWTRPQAIVILPIYALILLDRVRTGEYRSLWDERLWRHGLLTCAPGLLAFVAWILHISRITGLELSPITAQYTYGRGEFDMPWQRVWDRITFMSGESTLALAWGRLFEAWHLLLGFISLIMLSGLAAHRRVYWALVLFSALSVIPGLSTAIYAIGRYALLTWIPLTLIYLIPPKYDAVVIPFGLALSFVALTVLGLSLTARFIP